MSLINVFDSNLKEGIKELKEKSLKLAQNNTPVDKGNLKKSLKTQDITGGYEIVWGGTKETVIEYRGETFTYAYLVDLGTNKQRAQMFRQKTINQIKRL